MRAKYQPKHMKERDHMKLPLAPAKRLATIGLVGAMIAPSLSMPALALAAENDAQSPSSISTLDDAINFSFLTATRQLIETADQSAQSTAAAADSKSIDQLKQEFEQAKADYESAQKTQSQAQSDAATAHETYDKAVQTSNQADQTVSDAEIAQLQEELDALTVAKGNLDKANQELQQKQDELTAAEQTKNDADKALSNQEAVVSDLKSKLDATEQSLSEKELSLSDYNDVKAAYEQAQSDLEASVAAKEQAESDVQSAQSAIDAATQKVNDATASLPGLESEANAAASAVSTAQSEYDSALAAYNELLAQSDSEVETTPSVNEDGNPVEPVEPPTVSDGELADAKAALDSASSALATAQANKQQADADVAAAQTESTNAKNELATAQSQLETANGNLTAANEAVTAATTDRDNAKAAYDKAYQENKETLDAYNAAKGEYDEAKKVYDVGVQKYNELNTANTNAYNAYVEAQNKYNDLKDQVDSDTGEYTRGFNYFLAKINAIQALSYLQMADDDDSVLSGYVDVPTSSSPDNALAFENVQKALDIVKLVNDYRKDNNLSELIINPTLMVAGACDVSYSSNVQGHANAPTFDNLHISENLAWTNSAESAFTAWEREKNLWEGQYASYKQAFDAAVSSGNMTFNEAAVNLMNTNPDVYMAVGHYLNLINPDAIGIGVGYVNGTWEMCTNNFHAYNGDWTYDDFVAELESYMAQYKNPDYGNSGSSEEIAAAEQAMNDAYKTWQDTKSRLTAQQGENKKNKDTMDAAQEKLDAIGDVSSLDGDLQKLQDAYETAQSDLTEAQKTQASAQQSANDAKSEYDTAAKNAQDKAQELAAAQSAAKSASDAVESAYDAYQKAYDEHDKLMNENPGSDKLVAAYNEALDKYNTLVTAIKAKNDADAALQSVQDTIKQQNDIIAEQTEAKNSAQQALDGASEKIPALQTALDGARGDFELVDAAKQVGDQYDAAVAKRDDLKSAADNVAGNYDAIKAQVDDLINKKIPQLEKDVETVENADWDAIAQSGSDNPLFAKYVELTKALNDAKAAAQEAREALQRASDNADDKDATLNEANELLDAAKTRYDEALAAYLAAGGTMPESGTQTPGQSVNAGTQTAPKPQSVQQTVYSTADASSTAKAQRGSENTLPQTGDPAALVAVGTALAGAAAVIGGAGLNRRRKK